eukprot:sb/3477331/
MFKKASFTHIQSRDQGCLFKKVSCNSEFQESADRDQKSIQQEPTETSKQPIRTRYLCHVTGYQPIKDQYFLIRSVSTQRDTYAVVGSTSYSHCPLSASLVLSWTAGCPS